MIEPLHVRADARPRPDFLAGTKGYAIGGADADPLSGRTFETVDPVPGQPLATLGAAGPADVDELVIHRNGRLDFAALQRRIHPAAMHAARRGVVPAATLVLFDLLATRTRDLRHRPYRERRDRLERLLADTRPPLALMPATCDVAAAVPWLTEHLSQGVEGVVIKHLDHGYLPGRRSWQKIRTRTTSEAVVGGVFGPLAAPPCTAARTLR